MGKAAGLHWLENLGLQHMPPLSQPHIPLALSPLIPIIIFLNDRGLSADPVDCLFFLNE